MVNKPNNKLRNDLQPKAFSLKCLECSMRQVDFDSQHIHFEILQRQLKELEMKLDIANIKIINLTNDEKETEKYYEKELDTYKETNELIRRCNQDYLNDLDELNKKLIEKNQEIKAYRNEKLELETTINDLKQTLKLTEKESQHIRAKLLRPSSSNDKFDNEYKNTSPYRAIMPVSQKDDSKQLITPNDAFEHSEILNDFAIDVTHIEKVVQDTDLIMIEKKPLEGVQSCLKSLRNQMSELQLQVCNQVRASTSWQYKVGFTCEKCEMKWEIEHQVKDNNALNGSEPDQDFLQSSITQQLPKCNCPSQQQ